jgi:uncharacterized membrane protein
MRRFWPATLSVLLTASSCSVDPTEQVFTIEIRNDTDREVILSTCNTSCSQTGVVDRIQLAPGGVALENESSEGAPNRYVVTSVSGSLPYCFVLTFMKKEPNREIELSRLPRSGCT